MIRTFVSFFSFCFIAAGFISCGTLHHTNKQETLPGTWQAQPIIIDGDNKDWPSPYPNYDAKAKVAYATSNDAQNLYITVETGDEMTQVKMLKQGMAVSIDTGGKKDAQFHLNYPLPNENEPIDLFKQDLLVKDSRGSLIKRQSEQRINKLSQEANQFSLEGFGGCNGGYVVTQQVPCGIKVRAHIDEYKELVWEAVIPLKLIYNKETITAADAGHPISVCFSIKGFKGGGGKNPNAGGNPGMNDGMGGAGRNSAMQGGGAQGGRANANDPLQPLYESTKTWKQFSLVFKP